MSISDANSAKRARIASQSPQWTVHDQPEIHSRNLQKFPPFHSFFTHFSLGDPIQSGPEGCPLATDGRAHSRSACCVSSRPRNWMPRSTRIRCSKHVVFPRSALFMATTLCTSDSLHIWADYPLMSESLEIDSRFTGSYAHQIQCAMANALRIAIKKLKIIRGETTNCSIHFCIRINCCNHWKSISKAKHKTMGTCFKSVRGQSAPVQVVGFNDFLRT